MTQPNQSQDGSHGAIGKREVNIQNQLLNFIRKDKSLVSLFLVSGKKFMGQVVGFDRYTIHISGRDFDQVVFKHAITNISIPRQVMQKMRGAADREAGAGQPVESEGGVEESED